MKTAEDIINEKGGQIATVTHDTTIYDTLKKMIENRVGAVIVTLEGRPVGVWSSRDLMRHTVLENFDPKTARVKDHMSSPIHTAPHTDTYYDLMDKFLGLRVNHLPIVKDGEYIGILSSGDVMKANIQEKTKELDKLNKMVSWNYYEEWKWSPAKKNKL
jgi:CBS domain-containing protein